MTQPILYVAVGPSGSGKSTAFRKLKEKNPNINHFSWDDLRHEWYDANDYARAWEMSCADKEFKNKAQAVFESLIVQNQDLYIDNTNLTVKRRRPYINRARALGYKVVAITFDVDLKTAISRQSTRGDKYVSEGAVRKQFESLQPPTIGEFDKVIDSATI